RSTPPTARPTRREPAVAATLADGALPGDEPGLGVVAEEELGAVEADLLEEREVLARRDREEGDAFPGDVLDDRLLVAALPDLPRGPAVALHPVADLGLGADVLEDDEHAGRREEREAAADRGLARRAIAVVMALDRGDDVEGRDVGQVGGGRGEEAIRADLG